MSAASYMGLPVSLATSSGTKLTGTIISLNQEQATLTIKAPDGRLTTFKRSDIASLDIIQATNPGATSRPTGQSAAAAPTQQVPRPKTPPRQPAEQPQAHLSKSARKRLAAKERELAASSSSGPSSSPRPPQALAVPAPTAPGGKKKGKQSAAALTTTSSSGNEYDEDFDFDAALKTFDKQAIWKEIQANDTSDPMARLHAHNRAKPNGSSSSSGGAAAIGRTPSPGSYGRNAGRNAYQKLRNDENVLSPEPQSPPPSEPSRTPAPVAAAPAPVASAINGASSAEVAALREQLEVLSALAGLDIKPSSAAGGDYVVTLYSTPAQRTAAQRQLAASPASTTPAPGALTFALASGGATKKLRYLGPKAPLSDAEVLRRLPQSYLGEMGIGGERAAAFIARLKSCIEGKEA